MLARPAAPRLPRPLSRTEFLVLAILVDEPLHGYGVVKAIEERTGGEVRLRPANLYRVLDRLLDRGLLEEAEATGEASGGGERSRHFAATAAGRRAALAEAERLAEVIRGSERLSLAMDAARRKS